MQSRSRNFIILAYLISALLIPGFSAAAEKPKPGKSFAAARVISGEAGDGAKESAVRPLLVMSPGELALGDVSPGNSANGLYTIRKMSGHDIAWFTEGPRGWAATKGQRVTGTVTGALDYLRISLSIAGNSPEENTDKPSQKIHKLQLTIEGVNTALSFYRELPAGVYREKFSLYYDGGVSAVFFTFNLLDMKPFAALHVEPAAIDFGSIAPGKQATGQIKITNRGKETIKWQIVTGPNGDRQAVPSYSSKSVSFLTEEKSASGAYIRPEIVRDALELSGEWQEYDGYPSANGADNICKYRFSGTGIGVFLRRGPDAGTLTIYLDEQLINVYDGWHPERGRVEFTVADGLSDGPHVLMLVNGEGRAVVEGVKIYGRELMEGPPGWITFAPSSGTTTRETDYVNIRLDGQSLNPGGYGDRIVIKSSAGEVVVPIYAEVKNEQMSKLLVAYRYVRNYNYLYTTNPQAEAQRILAGGYRKEGVAFRLFAPGTVGTTEFYRWYNREIDDHYYSYDVNGGGKSLKGYVLEGSIGNIATSRLTSSRELYRWINPVTGRHFYTTDDKGEMMNRVGYKFDGIAGYVR